MVFWRRNRDEADDGSAGTAGPFVRFRKWAQDAWSGSVLVVVKSNHSRTISLTYTTPAGVRQSEGEVIGSYEGDGSSSVFFRFPLVVPLSSEQQVVEYSIDEVFGSKRYSFHVPGRDQPWHWGFFSCSGLSAEFGQDTGYEDIYPDGILPLWRDLLARHEREPLHLLIGGGDQIYNDGVFTKAQGIVEWLQVEGKEHRCRLPFTEEIQADVERYYFNHYLEHFGIQEMAQAFSCIPLVASWDDHDICDGYGSYPDYLQGSEIMQGLFKTARKYYLLFQHHRGEHETQVPGDEDTFGARGTHMVRRLGPHVLLVSPDTRSERTPNQVLPQSSWDEVFDKVEKELKGGGAGGPGVGGSYGQQESGYGQSGGRYGQQKSEYNQSGGGYGEQESGYGQGGGRYGQQESGYGQGGGRYGQQESEYNQSGGRYGQQESGYGQGGGRYGQQESGYGQGGGRYGQQESEYNQSGGRYGQQESGYGQSGGRYGQQEPEYSQSGGRYGQQESGYGQSEGQYGQQEPEYNQSGGGYRDQDDDDSDNRRGRRGGWQREEHERRISHMGGRDSSNDDEKKHRWKGDSTNSDEDDEQCGRSHGRRGGQEDEEERYGRSGGRNGRRDEEEDGYGRRAGRGRQDEEEERYGRSGHEESTYGQSGQQEGRRGAEYVQDRSRGLQTRDVPSSGYLPPPRGREGQAGLPGGGPVKHVCILLPVPIIYPHLKSGEDILGKLESWDPKKIVNNLMAKTGLWSSIMSGLNEPELLDDMRDHWTSKGHEEERRRLLVRCQKLAEEHSVRVTFLGGDVHVCAVGRLRSKGQVELGMDPRYMTQVVSSAIGNGGPPGPLCKVLGSGEEDEWDDGLTCECMMPVFDQIEGAASNKILNRRNWCEAWEKGPQGSLECTLRIECGPDEGGKCDPRGPISTVNVTIPVLNV